MSAASASLTISAVERETGIAKDTLRVWERRYGFPVPLRNDAGERRYPDTQVHKLRLIRQLIDRGLRPAKLLHQSAEQLSLCLKSSAGHPQESSLLRGELEPIMASIRSHAPDALSQQLQLALWKVGLRRFLTDFVDPLNKAVGDAWARGELNISEEHLYCEQIQCVLRHAIEAVPAQGPRPRILLATLPGEEHQLGLLMAHAWLALEGARCISLGLQAPLGEVQRAAVACAADIVGLSFGQASKEREARESLQVLRTSLPSHVHIWAGGRLWQHSRADMPGIAKISALTDISKAVAAWRGHRPEFESTRS